MIYCTLHAAFTPVIRGFLLVLCCVVIIHLLGCQETKAIDGDAVASAENASDSLETETSSRLASDVYAVLDDYFSFKASSGRFSGVVLLQHDHRFFKGTYGYRHLAQQDSLNLDDRFQLASLSKPITAFGLLTLVAQGKVDLDGFVDQYLFDFPFEHVTIRSLLNHTSGLGNYIYITDSLWNNPDSFMTNRNVYEYIRCEQLPVYYPPHKRFDYCNTNYALIPIIIEEVSKVSFQDYMKQAVFKPLGMLSTDYLDPFEQTSDVYPVVGHYPNGDAKRPFYLNGVVGDKGLYSNVFDLYKFYRELQSPSILPKVLVDEAFCPQVNTSHNRFYGLGWRIQAVEGDTMVFHNGWWRGFRSYFWMSKRDDKVAIILTNSIRGGYLKQEEIWSMF